jgi:hypothetical protein
MLPPPVGASLLAMVVNDYAGSQAARSVLESIVGTPPGASSLLQGYRFITLYIAYRYL